MSFYEHMNLSVGKIMDDKKMNCYLTFKLIECKIEKKSIYLWCNFIWYIGLSVCIIFLNVVELNNLKTIYILILYLSFIFHYPLLNKEKEGVKDEWGTMIIVRCEKKK